MTTDEQIHKQVEAAMHSVDTVQRAAAKPFLLTRIRARMNRDQLSTWEQAGRFIAKPAVAFTGLCLILMFNALVIIMNKTTGAEPANELAIQNNTEEYSVSENNIYDLYNIQP